PDFGEFFGELSRLREQDSDLDRLCRNKEYEISLPFESSRGCWWHDKCPCAFCGINRDYEYRLKSPKNTLSVFEAYRSRYDTHSFIATDANLSMTYFDEFLPRLGEAFPDGAIRVFYCMKTNMTRAQVKALADAGVRMVQPGIESLSNHVLQLMHKGASAMQNIFFLKCIRQYGIAPFWNLLLGTGGETAEDCREVAELIPKLTHLSPPHTDPILVRVHRYSEYWKNPEVRLDDMKPSRRYELLFPEDFDLDRLAYDFDAEWKDISEELLEARETVIGATLEWLRRWQKEQPQDWPDLRLVNGGTEIRDTRMDKTVKISLDPKEAAIYSLLDDIVAETPLLERAAKVQALKNVPGEEIMKILDSFVEHGLALQSGKTYLGLALREDAREKAGEEAEKKTRRQDVQVA
ncbi:MAG: RiPP maturation radical SAM C-methyltransferase, partial [Synergistaceae bacterium]|nr:RiPP maturation radical SAM C-methyltransferase [Synergistaceae bacterium]